jgi:hypothetical protein
MLADMVTVGGQNPLPYHLATARFASFSEEDANLIRQ